MTRKASAGGAAELNWFKSSYSDSSNSSECIEMAPTPDTVHIRDSKRPDGPRLALTRDAWSSFLTYASQG